MKRDARCDFRPSVRLTYARVALRLLLLCNVPGREVVISSAKEDSNPKHQFSAIDDQTQDIKLGLEDD